MNVLPPLSIGRSTLRILFGDAVEPLRDEVEVPRVLQKAKIVLGKLPKLLGRERLTIVWTAEQRGLGGLKWHQPVLRAAARGITPLFARISAALSAWDGSARTFARALGLVRSIFLRALLLRAAGKAYCRSQH